MRQRTLQAVTGDPLSRDRVREAFRRALRAYPPALQELFAGEEPRVVEEVSWLSNVDSVVDVGGGYSPFAAVCSVLGIRAVVVDSFDHPFFAKHEEARDALASLGVEFVRRDAVLEPLGFADSEFGAVTSFESLEHWHHSPRRLFAELARVGRPRALFVLSAPNAVNIRKRLAVPLGRTNWARFDDWYFEPVFHGHVREPVVADLARIAHDVGLSPWTVVGRNWLGLRGGPLRRLATNLVDRPLRLRPELCSNLYLVGRLAGT